MSPPRRGFRPVTLSAALLVALGGSQLTAPATAHACSCRERTPAEHVQAAEQIFVGRGTGDALEVLHVLKGQPGATVPVDAGGGLCSLPYRKGEATLAFVRRGVLSICNGNMAMDRLLPDLPTYLRLAGEARSPLPAAALMAARRAVPGTTAGSLAERHGPLAVVSLDGKPGRRHLLLLRLAPGAAGAWEVLHQLEQRKCPKTPDHLDGWQPAQRGSCQP